MIRSVVAVIAGSLAWTALWLGSNAVIAGVAPHLVQPDQPITSVALLGILVGLSLVFSVSAGWVTARIASVQPVAHTVALGILQLALGIFFQASNWALFPLWYHAVFLVLLIPGNVAGGMILSRLRRMDMARA